MSTTARYEVLLVSSESSLTVSEWTWRRLENDGRVSARGLRHGAINACFAEVRHHKTAFGDAAITVNLRGEDAPPLEPSPAAHLPPPTARRAAARSLLGSRIPPRR